LAGLITGGKILPDSRIGIARSNTGVVVRAGAPKPDISSVENFKRALLNAKSITYLPGTAAHRKARAEGRNRIQGDNSKR
jgi:hypothetical protein